jgi:hypothetical protein
MSASSTDQESQMLTLAALSCNPPERRLAAALQRVSWYVRKGVPIISILRSTSI